MVEDEAEAADWAAATGSVEEVVEGSAVEASETAVEKDSGAAVDLGVTTFNKRYSCVLQLC